jgi:hypothetical protein
VKNRIVDLVLKGKGMGWYATDHYIRTKLHYLTEMNDPNNVLTRLKQNVVILKDALNAKEQNKYIYIREELSDVAERDSLIVKLATILAKCEREPRVKYRKLILDLLGHSSMESDSNAYLHGMTLMRAVILDAYGQVVRMTRLPLNSAEKGCLLNYVQNPIDKQDPLLRGFDYWSIQDESLKVLKMGELLDIRANVVALKM